MVYHVETGREELVGLLSKIQEEQAKDQRLAPIKERIIKNDIKILPYYQTYNGLVFTKSTTRDEKWKLYIPKVMELSLIHI